MKHQIVIANVDETAILKTLGKFGCNSLGLRFMRPIDYARYVLEINGKLMDERQILKNEQVLAIYNLMQKIKYFANSSFDDARRCLDAINKLRNLTIDDSVFEKDYISKAEFQDKNVAICSLMQEYKNFKKDNNFYDEIDLMKLALISSNPINIKVISLKEKPLTYLETKIAKSTGLDYEEKSFLDLFKGQEKIIVKRYINGYGISNEIEEVLSDIYNNKINPDDVTLVLLNDVLYSPILREYSECFDIPFIFNSGISITKTNPYNLLKILNKWDTTGHHGIDAFKELFSSSSFDKNYLFEKLGLQKYSEQREYDALVKTLGDLKISFDQSSNAKKIDSYLHALNKQREKEFGNDIKKVALEFGKGCSYIIDNYSFIRKGAYEKIDQEAKDFIIEQFILTTNIFKNENVGFVLDSIVSKNISREPEKPGAIFVTDLKGAISGLRKHIYILGLSSDNFPGKNSEDSLILDNDYYLLSDINPELKSFIETSDIVIKNKIQELISFVRIACSADCKVSLSFSSYNLSEIKKLNPSSILMELFLLANPNAELADYDEMLKKSKAYYFKNNISPLSVYGRNYINKEISEINYAISSEVQIVKNNKSFSPTDIEKYVACQRMFYYAVMLKLEQKEEDDPFMLLDAREVGTEIHEIMEYLANKEIDEEEYKQIVLNSFERLLAKRPPLDNLNVDRERHEYLRMCMYGYKEFSKVKVLSAEKRIKKENAIFHPSGISLYGSPDRVEINDDGTLTIGDWKTGNKIKHKNNDVNTCIQTVIYAYITEKLEGKTVSNLEYRYLRKNRVIKCAYNENARFELSNILSNLNNSIDNGVFERTEDKEKCKYCHYQDICEGAKPKGDKEDE